MQRNAGKLSEIYGIQINSTKARVYPLGKETAHLIGYVQTINAEELKEKVVTVKIKTGEGGRVFGSVSTKEIAAAAKSQLNLDIDKKKLNLQEPIRMVGTVIVPYKVHPQVTGELKVKVVEA